MYGPILNAFSVPMFLMRVENRTSSVSGAGGGGAGWGAAVGAVMWPSIAGAQRAGIR
jgi:hypothetical protein